MKSMHETHQVIHNIIKIIQKIVNQNYLATNKVIKLYIFIITFCDQYSQNYKLMFFP